MRMIFRNIHWVAIDRVNLRTKGFGKILNIEKPGRRIV